jgi:hypothetical protein
VAQHSKPNGSLAATSAVAGILAGVLGAWLTGHWVWGTACGFLVLLGVVAAAEALKTRHDNATPPVSVSLSGNTSVNDALIAGRDINQIRTTSTIEQNRTTNFRAGGITAIVAILALGSAAGGTIYISQQPRGGAIESPQNLAEEGGHNSPTAAAKGFFGDVLLGDMPGACSYMLPDEQGTCNLLAPSGAQESLAGSKVGTGNAVVNGTLALVPMIGKLCAAGKCISNSNNGLPRGMSFQAAFQQAMRTTGNLVPCEEVGGLWYVSISGF